MVTDLSANRPLLPAESFTDDDLAAASNAVADWCRAHPVDFEPVFSASGFEQPTRSSITVSYDVWVVEKDLDGGPE